MMIKSDLRGIFCNPRILLCLVLLGVVLMPVRASAKRFHVRLGISSSRAWWNPKEVRQPLFGRLGLSGGVGYDLAKIGPLVVEPQILISQKYGYEIWNHRFPLHTFEEIHRYRFVDLLVSLRTNPRKGLVFFNLGPQLSIPIRMEEEVRNLNPGGSSTDGTYDVTSGSNLLVAAVGGVGLRGSVSRRPLFLEIRIEQGLNKIFKQRGVFNFTLFTTSIFTGLSF